MCKQIKTVGIICLLISSIIVISNPLLADLTRGQSSPSLGWSANYDYQVGDFPEHFAIGDIDKDGDLDLVVANLFDDTVTVYFNSGKGKFINRTDFITGTAGEGPRCVALADVHEDNNNDLDILVANHYGGTITVLTNDGTGNFAQPISYTSFKNPTCIKVGDFNKDNYIDIIVNDYYENKIGIMLNDGTGAFTLTDINSVGTHPRTFAILDIDGDNDIDIISADLLDDTITVYTNIGNGNFTYFDKYSTDSGPRGITSGDLDNDGDLDLVIANRHADNITVMKNRGDGNFSERYDYPCGDKALVPAIGDLDGDGDNDIGVICLGDNTLRIFNNSGTGNFSEYYDIILLLPGSYWLEIADLDKDNDNDLVISSAYSDKILTIFRDFPPDIVITEPDGVDDLADLTYTIKWIGTDPDENNILSVDLFYLMRMTEGEGGTEVVFGIPIVYGTENDGEYLWNCSEVPNGSYQLAATIYDDYGNFYSAVSDHNITITHNDSYNPPGTNEPPFVEILEPDGIDDIINTSYTIKWVDYDPDNDAFISLYYDKNNTDFNGILIQDKLSEDGELDYFVWNTSSVPEGEYYIYANISDNINLDVLAYSSGKVTIIHNSTSTEELLHPRAVISSPGSGEIFQSGEEIQFDGTESEGQNLTYFWISNLDGELGTTSYFKRSLSEGNHIITLTATDLEEASNSTSIILYVFNYTIENFTEIDSDNDTYNDTYEKLKGTDPFDNTSYPLDTDCDGIFDYLDPDDDNDGYNDSMEWSFGTNPLDSNSTPPDLDKNFLPDLIDPDIDGDGVPNEDDEYPYNPKKSEKEKVDNALVLSALIWIIFVIILFLILFMIVRKQNQEKKGKKKKGNDNKMGQRMKIFKD